MKKEKCTLLGITVLFTLLTCSFLFNINRHVYYSENQRVDLQRKINAQRKSNFHLDELIAHAAGEVKGITYTNSLEALNENYKKGFRFFEIDIHQTSDNHLVLLHDWTVCFARLFLAPPREYTLEEYKKLKMVFGLKSMTIEDLEAWSISHKDAFLISDIKKDIIGTLSSIKTKNPVLAEHLIPQIENFNSYDKVRELGYDKIILAVSLTKYRDENIISFIKHYHVEAVTMPVQRAATKLPARIKRLGVPVYAYTVNKAQIRARLKQNGIDGFYTDSFSPSQGILERYFGFLHQIMNP